MWQAARLMSENNRFGACCTPRKERVTGSLCCSSIFSPPPLSESAGGSGTGAGQMLKMLWILAAVQYPHYKLLNIWKRRWILALDVTDGGGKHQRDDAERRRGGKRGGVGLYLLWAGKAVKCNCILWAVKSIGLLCNFHIMTILGHIYKCSCAIMLVQ